MTQADAVCDVANPKDSYLQQIYHFPFIVLINIIFFFSFVLVALMRLSANVVVILFHFQIATDSSPSLGDTPSVAHKCSLQFICKKYLFDYMK